MNDEWVQRISERYIELYEKLTGQKFVKQANGDVSERVERNILRCLKEL
jgi:phosphoribosylaminoimidazole-succinocarboxamide synthase